MRWMPHGSSAEHSHAIDSQEDGEEEVEDGSKLVQMPKSSIKEVEDVTMSDDEASTMSLSTSELATADFRKMHMGNIVGTDRLLQGNLPVKPLIPNVKGGENKTRMRRKVTAVVKLEVEEEKVNVEPGDESEGSVVTRERCDTPYGIGFAMAEGVET